MPHPARHSRPQIRQQEEEHALGAWCLEELGGRRAPAVHRLAEDHTEQRAEHAQQRPEATAPPMSLRQDGAHASLMAPNSGAQHMVLGASPRAAAMSLSALVLHEAHGTGTALGGGLLRDAATCRGCSSHIRGACVGLKAQDEETGAQAPASACTAAQPDPPPWALPVDRGSDACAPPVDLAALVQLTAWIKVLGELIRKQDGEDSARFVDVRARAVSVLESWAQRWYDGQAISTP